MIEIIPERVERAFLYFHASGRNSKEFKPFIETAINLLPDIYIWVGDGNISGSPVMFKNAFYGHTEKKYWFMFPMQDACSKDSFVKNKEAISSIIN